MRARKLRRAQNDVLYSIGVVGKNDEQHRVDGAMQENTYGLLLHVIAPSLTVASGWWIGSLRARYQVRWNGLLLNWQNLTGIDVQSLLDSPTGPDTTP